MQIACTFMEWNPLRLTKSFSFSCGAWILMWVPSTQPITPGNPPLVKKPRLFWSISSSVDGHLMKFLCFCARASETWPIIRDTDDFDRPRVSPITWRKLPEAKKRNATRTCTVVDKAWFRDVSLSRSSRRSSDKNYMDSRPKRYRLLNSSSVKLDREKSSGSLNVLSFLLGAGIKPNPPSNKSAILFCLGKVFPRLVS